MSDWVRTDSVSLTSLSNLYGVRWMERTLTCGVKTCYWYMYDIVVGLSRREPWGTGSELGAGYDALDP